MKLKVCGLNEVQNANEVIACAPDYVGFIFYERSPRYAGNMDPSFLTGDQKVKRVGVFVNATVEEMRNRVKQFSLQAIQLHGEESPEICRVFKQTGVEVIKTFHVNEHFDLSAIEPYENAADHFLFDTHTTHYGGSGRKFDWRLLHAKQFSCSYFLSGGIDPEDIEYIRKEKLFPFAIDINSRFETVPGIKDIEKIKQVKRLIEKQHATVHHR